MLGRRCLVSTEGAAPPPAELCCALRDLGSDLLIASESKANCRVRLTKRVLLIGWDAADWQLANPLLEQGGMPALQGLIDRGVSGRISTLQPIISPILWNSIATGKRADKHGILGFVEPNPAGTGVRPVSSTSRRAKAIWNILSQRGLRSCVVGWYASHPAEPINGCVLTDRFQATLSPRAEPLALDRRAVHPDDLYEVAEALRVHPHSLAPKQLLPFFPEGGPKDPKDPRLSAAVKLLAECATIHNAATYFAEHEKWDFMAVYYDAIDHFCHGFMEYHSPAMIHVSAEDARVYGRVILGAYQFHDMMLQRLLDLVGPETTVIVLSDHGFYSDSQRPALAVHAEESSGVPPRRHGAGLNPLAWHRPQGIFVAAGPAVKKDELVHGATLLDVAPTVLALLGLPIAEDMDGVALTQIFESVSGADRISSYETPDPADGVHRGAPVGEQNPWQARQGLEQLAALGYVELSETGDAAEEVRAATEDRKSNLAQVYHVNGRYTEALELLQEVLWDAKRELPHVRCRIALCLLGLGRPAEAEPLVRKVMEAFPQMPLAKLILGQIKADAGEVPQALALLREVEKTEARLPLLHVQLGQIHLRERRWEEAERAFRHALEIDDDCAEAHDGLGVVLQERGAIEEAIFEHMRAASLMHHRPQTHVNLGRALTAAKQIDWAIRAFSVAAELAPEQPFPHRCLAHLYRNIKRDREKARHHTMRARNLRAKLSGARPAFIAGA